MSSFEARSVPKTLLPAAVLSVSALALSGCGDDQENATPAAQQSDTPSSSPSSNLPTLEFDYLGARSTVIRVYASPEEGQTMPNGTYLDGDTVGAICKEEGREVSSVSDEIDRTSNDWIYFEDANRVGHYATAVYVVKPEKLLASLDEC